MLHNPCLSTPLKTLADQFSDQLLCILHIQKTSQPRLGLQAVVRIAYQESHPRMGSLARRDLARRGMYPVSTLPIPRAIDLPQAKLKVTKGRVT